MLNFNQLFTTMERMGVVDSFLPFILIFTILFAMFEKIKVLGEGKKNFNIVVSLAIALLAVIPHVTHRYPPNADIVLIINNSLPNIALVIIAIIMLLTLTGITGTGIDKVFGANAQKWLSGIAIAIVIFIFGRAAGWFGSLPRWLMWLDDPNTQALVIIILVFGLVIKVITGSK